ncbi:RrF2 family transcriptional regulator [Duganella callida]|uniref:Rrf2 family transcriptional regulator n=1 Tax=Duganella callida TaxID=2561932 RepID=A0A4Y9SHZ8_9BURK|nr:Rrf2 family transcriptional regulator [Duganella callida]TFW21440.1 Rrf2 family transcriptional regulator [Duganella callida]
MRLTTFTDYSLRTLLHLGMHRDRLVTIQDIAEAHGISRNHLMKVVYQLGVAGYIDTVRGRNGGLRLKMEPSEINLGAVVRATETDFHIAECFGGGHSTCPLLADCRLKNALGAAAAAFLATLDMQTLATLLPAKPSASTAPLPLKFQRLPAAA